MGFPGGLPVSLLFHTKTVSSFDEALELAVDLKAKGVYDLFRGQADAEWSVQSSLERVAAPDRAEVLASFERYCGWAMHEPGMEPYRNNPDALEAIAQHYGIPTRYIDFTDDPSIAGFFAMDRHPDRSYGSNCSFICVNTHDFDDFWGKVIPHMPEPIRTAGSPKFLRFDVENLWRLQMQRGCFLHSRLGKIERVYDFDRIIFPHSSGHRLVPARNKIYPANRSPLEKDLENFFMNEAMRAGSKAVEEVLASGHFAFLPFNAPGVEPYESRGWHPGGVPVSSDWEQARPLWTKRVIEHASQALGATPVILQATAPADLRSFLRKQFTLAFIQNQRERSLLLDTSSLTDERSRILAARIERLWDGMRRLPYLDKEIQISLQGLLDLFEREENTSMTPWNGTPLFEEECQEVEFGPSADGRGAYSRAYVTERAARRAFNPVFVDAAAPLGDSSLVAFLLTPSRPWEKFTFSGLRNLMVEEIIPTQVYQRCEREENGVPSVAVYFSPFDLKVFGVP